MNNSATPVSSSTPHQTLSRTEAVWDEGRREVLSAYFARKTPKWLPTKGKMLDELIDMVDPSLIGCVNVAAMWKAAGDAEMWRPLRFALAPQKVVSGRRMLDLEAEPLPDALLPEVVTQEKYAELIAKAIEARKVPSQTDPLTTDTERLVQTRMVENLDKGVGGLYRKVGNIQTLSKIGLGRWYPDALVQASLVSFAGSFFVEKSDKIYVPSLGQELNKLRNINDARAANLWLKEPTYMPLFSLPALLQTISDVQREARKMEQPFYMFNADNRHWFFQFSIQTPIATMMTLRGRDGSFYVPNCMMMGWSLAPLIAQTGSWAMILAGGNAPGLGPPDQQKKLCNRVVLPEWLPFVSAIGGIFVLIDNMFGITTDEDTLGKWTGENGRLNRQANRFGVRFKPTSRPILLTVPPEYTFEAVTAREMESEELPVGWPTKSQRTFNGIEVFYDGWRAATRKSDDALTIPWKGTHRRLAALLGETMWCLRVANRKLLDHAELLPLYKMASPPDLVSWDDDVELTREQCEVLKSHFDLWVCERPLVSPCAPWPAHGGEVRVAVWVTDAAGGQLSRSSIAAVCLTGLGDSDFDKLVDEDEMRVFQEEPILQESIHTKELRGIHLALKKQELRGESVDLVLVLTDNVVAESHAERMISDDPVEIGILRDMDRILQRLGNARLVPVRVGTSECVADVPSRVASGTWKPELLSLADSNDYRVRFQASRLIADVVEDTVVEACKKKTQRRQRKEDLAVALEDKPRGQ